MDIYEPIREFLVLLIKEEQPTEKMEYNCGIKSSCYPPSELYPDGHKVEYKFPMNPKNINFFNHAKTE